MKKDNLFFKTSAIIILSLALFFELPNKVSATTITVSTSVSWSTITTGSGISGIPGSSDNIIINSGATLTVDLSNAVCASIVVGDATSATNGKLTFAATGSPALIVSGTITVAPSGVTGTVTMVSGATLTAAGMGYGGGTATENLNAGNVIYTGTFTVPLAVSNTYNNLTIASGTMSIVPSLVINGTLTINSGAALNPLSSAITVSGGSLVGNGTIYVTHTGSNNDLTSQYPGTLTLTNLTINYNGTSAQNLNTAISPLGFLISNTSGVTFYASETPGANGTIVNGLLIVGASYTLGGTLTGTGAIVVTHTGGGDNLTSQYTGTLTLTNITINFNGASAQNLNTGVSPLGFIISNTSGVAFNVTETPGANGTIVNGLLSVASSNTLGGSITGTGTIKVTHNGTGSSDLTAQYTGTLTLTNLTINYAGTGTQYLNSVINPLGIVISGQILDLIAVNQSSIGVNES